MVCWRKSAFSWPLASRLFLGLLTSLFPGTIRKLGGSSDGCAHMPAVVVLGSSTSQIDVFFTAVMLTIIPNGPWKRGLSTYLLVSWHCTEAQAPRRRTEAAWKCSASHNGIQARLVGE